MDIRHSQNTYLALKDSYGKIRNEQILIVARTGYGKGLASEAIIEEYHNAGYTILNIADPKDELELAYAMFEPKEPYHLKNLRMIGKASSPKKVKLYHPFTFRIPKTKIPPFNFFTFSFKELGHNDWSLLAEAQGETDTIRLLKNASQNISDEIGIYGFLHYVQDVINGPGGSKKESKPDPKNFYLSATSGTMKSMQAIANYLRPFLKDYFLSKHNSEHRLDWKEILNDQEHYHVFTSQWIKDPKLKSFVVLALLNKIIENKNHAKKPILIFIPEIRKLAPLRPKGYDEFLARGVKEALSMIRSQGKGMSSILDSQVYRDIDETVRNSPSVTLFGELGGPDDIEKVSKAMNYRREIRAKLNNMECENSYIIKRMEHMDTFRMWFPGHMHCEPSYNFTDMFKKHYLNETKSFLDFLELTKQNLFEEKEKYRKKMSAKIIYERDSVDKKKIKTPNEEVKTLKKKVLSEKQKAKLEKMKMALEYHKENRHMSLRSLGKKFGVSHVTMKKWLLEISKKDEISDDKNHEEAKFVTPDS